MNNESVTTSGKEGAICSSTSSFPKTGAWVEKPLRPKHRNEQQPTSDIDTFAANTKAI